MLSKSIQQRGRPNEKPGTNPRLLDLGRRTDYFEEGFVA
jgi:hypothetical protein